MTHNETRYEFDLSSGALCLDFANTVGDRRRSESEHLKNYEDLLSWAEQAKVIDRGWAAALQNQAGRRPKRATAVFGRAVELRETLYRIFAAGAAGGRPSPEDVATVNRELGKAMAHYEIVEDGEGFRGTWGRERPALDAVLWPVIHSAAELLTSEDAVLVKECASETCTWLFLDQSRAHRRKWCDMATCGNRAKARRHYRRRRLAASASRDRGSGSAA